MEHAPSHARRLVAQARDGVHPSGLVQEAQAIEDPYHAAWALAGLSGFRGLPATKAAAALEAAFERLAAVPQSWRQGELLAHLAKATHDWRGGDAASDAMRARLPDLLLAALRRLDARGRANALPAVAPCLRPSDLPPLVTERADAEGAKHVVAAWAARPAGADAMLAALRALPPDVQARLLAHIDVHARRAGTLARLGFDSAYLAAEAAARAVAPVEALRAVVAAVDPGSLKEAVREADAVGPEAACRIRCAAAARADKAGDRATAMRWLQEAGQILERLPPEPRASVAGNVAQGLDRLGLAEEAGALRTRHGVRDAKRAPSATHGRANARRGGAGVDRGDPGDGDGADGRGDARGGRDARAADPTTAPAPAPGRAARGPARPIVALHNGYDGALGKPHLQAAARIAPLAAAFGFDVALVGFPVEDVAAFAHAAQRETRVGEGLAFVAQLVGQGRLRLLPRDVHAAPHRWAEHGLEAAVVALTQEPDPAKAVDLRHVLRGPRGVCLVIGLGHRGLPPQLLAAAPHHLELTGAGVPLETATVMGLVAERLRQAMSG